MAVECFNCSRHASERYTLILENPDILEERWVCDVCVSDFQSKEWVEVHEAPVLKKGGGSISAEYFDPDESQEVDELLSTLSNAVRREVIHYFENHTDETTISVEKLATHIESRMSSKTSEDLSKTLSQVHLPTLQSRGWLEFDTQHYTITYHGHPEAEGLLRKLRDIFIT